MATTELVTQKPNTLRSWLSLDDTRKSIADALGGMINPDHFLAQMLISFEKKPETACCTPKSKFECVNLCAALGLMPTLGHVALIPRENRKAGVFECTVMAQWQGFQVLMLRCPDIKSVHARLIHSTDTYQWNSETEMIAHQYDPFAKERTFSDWKDVTGGYLIVTYHDGSKLCHPVSLETLQKARRCAKADNIWQAWFQEQCLKTIYRNAFARRVIRFDPVGEGNLKRLEESTDVSEQNDPARVAEVDSASPVSRVESLRKKVTRTIEVETQPDSEFPPDDNHSPDFDTDPEPEHSPVSEVLAPHKTIFATGPAKVIEDRLLATRHIEEMDAIFDDIKESGLPGDIKAQLSKIGESRLRQIRSTIPTE